MVDQMMDSSCHFTNQMTFLFIRELNKWFNAVVPRNKLLPVARVIDSVQNLDGCDSRKRSRMFTNVLMFRWFFRAWKKRWREEEKCGEYVVRVHVHIQILQFLPRFCYGDKLNVIVHLNPSRTLFRMLEVTETLSWYESGRK